MLLRHLIVLMIDVREIKLAKTYDQKDHLCLPNTHDFAAGPINLGQRARCRMSSSRICSLFTMTNSSADPLARTTKPKMFPGFGGARRDRTDDLKLEKLPLSQLSYGPFLKSRVTRHEARRPVGLASPRARKNPARKWGTLYRTALDEWWAWEDLNLRPHAYQARALTN